MGNAMGESEALNLGLPCCKNMKNRSEEILLIYSFFWKTVWSTEDHVTIC